MLVTATDTLFKKSRKGRIEQRLGSLEQLITSVLLPFEASDPKDIVFSVLQIAKDTSTFGNHDQKKQPFLMALVGIIFHGGLLFLSTRYCNTLEMSLNRIARVSPPLLHNIIPARFAQKWYSASKSTYKSNRKAHRSCPLPYKGHLNLLCLDSCLTTLFIGFFDAYSGFFSLQLDFGGMLGSYGII